MAEHSIIIDADDGRYLETRPSEIQYHVNTSPTFRWTVDETLVAWLDIAHAYVEIRDQLRSDRLVVNAEATIDNETETIVFTLTSGSYPVRATHYKMVLVIEKTDATYVRYPLERPGFVKLIAHKTGEDPLSLEDTVQALQDATGILGAINNQLRNPPRIVLVDSIYQGYEIAGLQYGTPNEARLWAIDYITENGGQVNIIVHSDGTDFISPDRTKWEGYTPHANDASIIVTSSLQVRNAPHRVYEAGLVFSSSGSVTAHDSKRSKNDFGVEPVFTRLSGNGDWSIKFPGVVFDADNLRMTSNHQFAGSSGPHGTWLQRNSTQVDSVRLYILGSSGTFYAGSEAIVHVVIEEYAA